jgi:hypothetical protein
MPTISVSDILNENERLRKEVAFLRERNKDLRQKTWIQVYDENLRLIAENNHLRECNQKHFDVRMKCNLENKRLKDGMKSVQEFTKQFTE